MDVEEEWGGWEEGMEEGMEERGADGAVVCAVVCAVVGVVVCYVNVIHGLSFMDHNSMLKNILGTVSIHSPP